MFREMRRKKQMLSLEECVAVLDNGTSGVLAVDGDNDYPYAVPLSYVYCDSKIFFHCARSGHKLDAIARNEEGFFLCYRGRSSDASRVHDLFSECYCFRESTCSGR